VLTPGIAESPLVGLRTIRAVASYVFALCVLGGNPSAAENGEEKVPHEIPKATSVVVIDGAIDESAWQEALTLELRYEVMPGENTEPPVRTVGFITYDDRRVLVAFRCYDPRPEEIRARYRDRDRIGGDDVVGVTLDTFNDQRRAFEFMVNPFGAQFDGVTTAVPQGFDRSWDAIWDSAGRLTDFGYEVEIAIPFNQLRFQPSDEPQIWGLDLTRTYPREDRIRIGLFPRERGANSYLAQAEKVVGFAGVSRGRNIELVPTLTAFATEERPDFPDSMELENDASAEMGATIRWGMTPNITLSGAINPDFSQVEADAVQLAINERFALFFEERRPFFLEGADYFDTGLNLLYTRVVADPLAALKVTGKVGRHTVGVFTALDEVTNLIVPGPEGSSSGGFEKQNLSSVGRYRYDLGAGSTVGTMITDRQGSDGYFNRVASIDGVIRPSSADSISFDLAFSRTAYSLEMQEEFDITGEALEDHGARIEYIRTNRNWFAFAEYVDFGDDFRADLGFIPRVGYREGNTGAGYIWWGDSDQWYNRLEAGGFLRRTEEQNGDLLSDAAEIWLDASLPLQTFVHLELGHHTEVSEGERFENLFIPVLVVRGQPSGTVGFRLGIVGGDWVDFDNLQPAERLRVNFDLGLNLGRHFDLELKHVYSRLDVDGGALFEANVPQMWAVWQFNTRSFVRVILQYTDIQRNPDLYLDEVDPVSRDFFMQLLFSYKVNPQTVAFLGYSEGGVEDQDIPMTTTNRSIFFKLGYAFLW
jgi:hypothetical protein